MSQTSAMTSIRSSIFSRSSSPCGRDKSSRLACLALNTEECLMVRDGGHWLSEHRWRSPLSCFRQARDALLPMEASSSTGGARMDADHRQSAARDVRLFLVGEVPGANWSNKQRPTEQNRRTRGPALRLASSLRDSVRLRGRFRPEVFCHEIWQHEGRHRLQGLVAS